MRTYSRSLKVHTQGKAGNPALLFLHAFPFSGAMWKEQLAFFSNKFYCLAPDFSGFGESSLPSPAVLFESYVDSILNYLAEEKIEESIWCGLSMGGYAALRMYERAPEKCRALILCDTKAGADGNEAKLKRSSAFKLIQKSRSEYIAHQWDTLVSPSSQKNETLKKLFEELLELVSTAGMTSGLVALATRTDCSPGLSKILAPVLIIVGEDDHVTPLSEAETMAKAISGSQLKIIDGSGHLSNIEKPREFNESVSDFLMSLNR